MDKGFGFITPDDRSLEVFVHINEFRNRKRQPAIGDHVSYTVVLDAQARVQARGVLFQGEGRLRFIPAMQIAAAVSILAYIVFLTLAIEKQYMPFYAAAIILVWNSLAYLLYNNDKRAAERGTQRVPEAVLHLVAVSGGWPAAWIAQFRLRHKTSKTRFMIVFYLAVFLNMAAMACLALGR